MLCSLSLRRERSPERRLKAAEIDPDTPFLRDFLAANDDEIRRSQPDYEVTLADDFVRILLRDGLPGGSIAGRKEGPELIIAVDYVTPAYQDSRIGRWVFGEGREMFTRVGIRRLVTTATTSSHRNYLQQMGFRPDGTNWVKDLTEPVE